MNRAFIVYSSIRHVSYMKEVRKIIETVLDSLGIKIVYLGDGFRGIRFYPEMLRENIKESDFGIVILDGLRPNVTYELGLLQMSKMDVIPLIKSDAKFSVKSAYYNLNKKYNDPELAFGNYRYHKSAFDNLKEPNIIMQEHLSDCQGLDENRYTTIDDTEEDGSLGKVLREEIEKIIPHLISRTGPDFSKMHLLFPNIEPTNLLDESIRLLSLFSVLGWNKHYEEDTTFQSIREEFLSLYSNQPVSEEEISSIFNTLLENSESILKNYGRYLTINSENLIRQSFEYFMQNEDIFSEYYRKVMNSTQTELKKRFIERIRTSDFLDAEKIEAIGSYIFDSSNFFTDISTIQDKAQCQFFVTSASIHPSKAMDLLYKWILPLTPMRIAELFPFGSSLISPGNPHDDVLWFLNKISKINTFFTRSMEILFKFSLPIIVYEELVQTQIHPYIHKLALDRFLEQCHSLEGEVNVITRWNFIRDLSWSDNWPEDYIKATKELKFRAIQAFLQSSWTIPGPVIEGRMEIKRYDVPDGMNYDELESCRTEAYRIIMEWLDQKDEYNHIYNLFDYFYHNLSDWVKYIPWNEIKSLYERIFSADPEKILTFLNYIDNLHSYDTWQQDYSDENLRKIFQFHNELEESLSTKDYFRRNLGFSEYDTRIFAKFQEEDERQNYISQIQSTLMEKFNSLTNSERDEIIKLLISENLSQSFDFGVFFPVHLSIEELKDLIVFSTELIGTFNESFISEFYIGLWSRLFRTNEQEWEYLLNENWADPNIQSYLKKVLGHVGIHINNFIWNKYLDLLNAGLIEPLEILYVFHKELPSTIPNEEIKNILINCIENISESIQSENQYPIEEYISIIWRLEHIIKMKEYLFDNVVAASFLEKFYPISKEILSQLHDAGTIIKFGQLAPEQFKNWLKIGFQLYDFEGNHFLIKCAYDFIEQIFEIIELLFSLPQDVEELTEDHYISRSFENSGDPGILLKFSEAQIEILYELNSSKLGYLFGRLIKNASIEDIFPPVLKRLIILHNEDTDFKKRIFSAFSSGVRSFVGNNYDQMYVGDYARITQWRESETNNVFREWLRELNQYIDSLRDQDRDFWRESEVE